LRELFLLLHKGVRYVWDPAKAASNFAKHGVEFAAVVRFDWATATTEIDARRAYGEQRLRSVGWIEGRIFVLIHTSRGDAIRLISLRRANRKEILRYGTAR
jgi:uncharacterized DUF497 family protein